MLTALLLAVAAGAAPSAPDGAVKLVVLSTRIDRSSEKDLAGTVTELVLSALAKGRNVHIVGEADVLPFLDEAAQKQLRNCDDDAACLVEIGGALGTDYLVSVSLGAIGSNYLLAARILDPLKGSVVERQNRTLGRNEDELASAICPLMLGMLASLSQRDPRVGGDAASCLPAALVAVAPTPVVTESPVPATAPVFVEPIEAGLIPPNPPPLAPAKKSAPLELGFAVRAGSGPQTGMLGLGVELELGRLGLALGTGLYALTGAVTWNLLGNRGGPYVSAHGALAQPGLAARLLAHDDGLGFGATAGWDLRPFSRLSVRAGVGAAWTSVTWKDGATRSPLVLELGIGPVF